MLKVTTRRPSAAALAAFERGTMTRIERASAIAADKAAAGAREALKRDFTIAGARRLGGAIGAGSDRQKQRGVLKRPGGFSTSGWVYVRSRSERTQGAIEAYTAGGEIRPVSGKWLWIPTDAIPARVGRYRMTPKRYLSSGLTSSIGPLIFKPGRNGGEALLVVRDVSVRVEGRAKARRLPRRGAVRAGRRVERELVAFVGIRRTNRSRLINVDARMRQAQAAVEGYFRQEIAK